MSRPLLRPSAPLFRIHAFRRHQNFRLHSTHPPPPLPSGGPGRGGGPSPLFISSLLAASLLSYTFGSISPPSTLTLLFPRPAPPPPTDLTSPSTLAYLQSLEDQLQSLPLLHQLRNSPDNADWYESRPYTDIAEERRVNHLTSGVLRGPGKLAVKPLVRARKDETESVVFVHVGRALCGYDGIAHGGLLATLLDEALARTAITNFPDRVGVTANLNLNYKAPTRADQFIVIRTKLGDVKGRRASVSARVEDLQGNLLIEATGIFVQPRYAKFLNSGLVQKALGGEPAPGAVTQVLPKVQVQDG